MTPPDTTRRPTPASDPRGAPRAPRLLLAALTAGLLLACNGGGESPDRPSTARDTPGSPDRDRDTTRAGSDQPVCLRGQPFVSDGQVPVQAAGSGDARKISHLRWERHDGCERFVIDLTGEDDAPATSAGNVHAEVLRDLGVVRIHLRDVERVDPDATDARFDGALARAAYAVWSPDGRWTYVDLHLADPAEAHVLLLSEPGRVVVDLRPGGAALPTPPATSRRVVVLEPRPGLAAYPLTVTGYARTFEANVVARLEAPETVRDTFTTATAWVDAWGHYSMTFHHGPTGSVELHVGEHSARDGTWEGAAVELEVR